MYIDYDGLEVFVTGCQATGASLEVKLALELRCCCEYGLLDRATLSLVNLVWRYELCRWCVSGRIHNVKLNEDQMKIVDYVRTKKRHLVAPLVVYGAFGTGKTESLAQSAILLTSCNDDVKLLICTQTNS